MYKINGSNITLTRGDTFVAVLTLTKNGEPYTPDPEDTIRFAMKHKKFTSDKTEYADDNPLLVIAIDNEDLMLRIPAGATKPFGFGKYAYDVELTYSDGTVDTFIEGDLILSPEVD